MNLEKISEAKVTCADIENDRAELADLLSRIAGQSGSMPERIARAAHRLGWNYRRAKAHWYGEARRIENHEMRSARAAAAKAEEASTNAEIAKLQLRLARLEALISASADQGREGVRYGRRATDEGAQ